MDNLGGITIPLLLAIATIAGVRLATYRYYKARS